VDVVNITSVNILEYHRPLAGPLRLSSGVISQRHGVIIRIIADNGMDGFGEAAPLPGFSPETLESTTKILRHIESAWQGKAVPASLNGIGDMVRQAIPAGYPAAVFGLETALCDLAAQASGRPLASWLNENAALEVPVNYLTTGNRPDQDKTAADFERGKYDVAKIKVGGRSEEDDIAFVGVLVKLLGGNTTLRLDANRQWTYDAAVRVLNSLREYRIEYVEEPLENPSPTQLIRLKTETGISIALDETLAELGDVETWLEAGAVDVLIIKPTILGGIARAVQLMETAQKYGRNIVVTSTFESEVGLTALVHLAAAISPATACGLNTCSIFEPRPFSHNLSVKNGAIAVPMKPGLGLNGRVWGTT
jgi:o-succinylbenzoate synthase